MRHGHLLYYQAIYCLRFYCCHGDSSDRRYVHSKYHDYYQATMLVIIVTMAMVVMGGMCVRSIYDGHTYYYQQLIGCYVGNRAL